MRRGVLVLMVGLLLLGTLALGVEALTGCSEPCDYYDVDGGCTREACCSCCLHTGPAALGAATHLAPLSHAGASHRPPARRAASADPRDLLHVPKTALR